jgi:hypothetical protein
MMVRLIGRPTRHTNSCHASSSQGPAQRQMTSFRDKEEYRVGLETLDILLFPFPAACAMSAELMVAEIEDMT